MKLYKLTTLALAISLVCGYSAAFAQNDSGTKQDFKNAGTNTKAAAKDTGRGVKQGTRKGYHKTKKTTHKAAQKVSDKTDSK